MTVVASVVRAMQEARTGRQGAVCFVRCIDGASVRAALDAFLDHDGDWTWHEIDATTVADLRGAFARARALLIDPQDACILYGLPGARGAEDVAEWYASLGDPRAVVDADGGIRVVVLVGVAQMQALVKHAPRIWARKKAYVAWPTAPSGPAGAGPSPGRTGREPGAVQMDPAAVKSIGDDPAALGDYIEARLGGVTGVHDRAKLALKLAKLRAISGDVERARIFATQSARGFKDENDLEGLAQTYELLGSLAERRGNLGVAQDWMRHAAEMWSQLGDESRTAACHAKLGHLAYVLGDRGTAAQQFQMAIEIDEALGNKSNVAAGLRRLGLITEDEGNFALAERLYGQALEIAEQVGDKMGVARTYHHLGRLAERKGDYAEAHHQHSRSLAVKQEIGDRPGLATTLHHLGNTYFFSNDFARAREFYEKALALEADLNDHQGRAATLKQLGDVDVAEFRWEEALRHYISAYRIWKYLESPLHQAVAANITRVKEMLDESVIDDIEREVLSQREFFEKTSPAPGA